MAGVFAKGGAEDHSYDANEGANGAASHFIPKHLSLRK
jgi:hypothetical protein